MTALSTKPPRFPVHLPAFDGPLDLLLTVIRARRLDVSLVSLAAITRDFVDQVRSLEDSATADTAEFLVMAAHLVELKARLLLPNTASDVVDETPETAEDLVCRLRAYETFKEAATFLAECLERELPEYPTLRSPMNWSTQPGPPTLPAPHHFRDIANNVMAGRRLLAAQAGAVTRAWVSLETCMRSLATKLVVKQCITFQEAIVGSHSTDRVVGTFLAVLHLWKRGEISVRQTQPYGTMLLTVTVSQSTDSAVAAES